MDGNTQFFNKFSQINIPGIIIAVTLCLICGLTMPGCDIRSSSIDQATEVIDNGIRDIRQNSDMWQTVLQRVADELPDEISETIRADAQSLVTRSIATAGIEFRCDTDFLANRAIQSLQRLKAELLNQNPPPLPPSFCQVDPPSIDLKIDPARWSTAIISGYDFDHRDSSGELLKIILLTEQGYIMPFSEARIGRTTHYQITLNLGNYAHDLYSNKVTKIMVSWAGKTQGNSEIVIVPWEPKKTTIWQVPVGITGPYTPPHIKNGGDADFHTGDKTPTDLTLQAEMLQTEREIQNRMYMYAREKHPDHTTVEGWSAWSPAYSAPENYRILSVRPNSNSSITTKVTTKGRLAFDRPAGEIVDYFETWVDTKGDEAGSDTKMTTHWRPLDITIEEIEPDWLR